MKHFRWNAGTYIPWIAFIAVPLLVNGIVWKTFVVPQRARVKTLHDAQTLAAIKPKLKALLTESHKLRVARSNTGFAGKESQAVMQAIQKSAGRNGVQITETKMNRQETQGAMPLELEVAGSFSKLAHWISDVETQDGFRIDSWTLRKNSAASSQLTVKVTVLLGGA
ncbi:MAG: type II secretion system protein M [Candidatus Omnitrophica bacterium]|nr:type II secretion system protein M [Candidatus Omnitrophota bacterium]